MKIRNLRINLKSIISCLLIGQILISLSGCSYKKSYTKSSGSSSISNSQKLEPNEEQNKSNVSFEVKEDTPEIIEKYTIDNYNYTDLYNLDAVYNKYKKASNILEHPDSKLSGSLTADKLYNVVKSNNDSYLDSMKKATSYNELSDSNLRKVCSYIVDAINAYAHLVDIEEVNCSLSNMRIFTKNTISNATVSDNNVMVISDKFFSVFKKADMPLEQVVKHEATHFLQKSCSHRLELGENYIGISMDFEDESLENFTFSWFYEGASEICSSKNSGLEPVKYLNDIKYINLFNFVSLDPNFKLEEISFSKDVDSLFKKFGCNDDESKKKLLNVFYGIEIYSNRPKNISKKISDTYENTDSVYKKIIRDCYKYYIELFFYNLNNNIQNMSKEDIFKHIILFEAIINNEFGLNMNSMVVHNEDFMSYYNLKKDEFFKSYSNITNTNSEVEYIDYLYLVDSSNFSILKQDSEYSKLIKSLISTNIKYIGKDITELPIYNIYTK